jgi:hypothetical protein
LASSTIQLKTGNWKLETGNYFQNLISFAAIQHISLTWFPSFIEYPNSMRVPVLLAPGVAI